MNERQGDSSNSEDNERIGPDPQTGTQLRPPGDANAILYAYLAHRRVVGYLGLILPLAVVVVAWLRSTPDLQTSISAYYYTGAVAVFVGVLFAIGFFLFSYQGYEGYRADRRAGKAAFVCALGIAVFPTGPPTGVQGPPWLTPSWIHYVFAVLLFLIFIYFSGWLFTRTTKDPQGPSPGKLRRNKVYRWCAGVMIACIVALVAYFLANRAGLLPDSIDRLRPLFVLETILLAAFAVSWLTKGRAVRELLSGFHRLKGAMRIGG